MMSAIVPPVCMATPQCGPRANSRICRRISRRALRRRPRGGLGWALRLLLTPPPSYGDGLEASLSSYFVDYRNRLVSVANCQLTAFCASVYENVGTIVTKGLEGLVVVQLAPGLSWNASASYNSSIIQD